MSRSSTTRTRSVASQRTLKIKSPSVFDHSHHAYHRRTMGQHGAHILMLWVVLLGFSLAGGLMILIIATRLQILESKMKNFADIELYMMKQESRISQLLEAVQQLSSVSSSSIPAVSPPGSQESDLNLVPAKGGADLVQNGSSPSGILSRGSVSADGSKFAGYEDVKVGKKGVAVELLNDTTTARKERFIVIFNALTESTGIGTPFEKEMSVRWKDAKTIEYDVLVKVKSEWKKEKREVQIFF
ncbi:hypothetical protein IT408_04515 [Candidatus Uhrbacteria bacterium]|nr:hypothetical protein [Candidatus Uhrbacteria bacterium]